MFGYILTYDSTGVVSVVQKQQVLWHLRAFRDCEIYRQIEFCLLTVGMSVSNRLVFPPKSVFIRQQSDYSKKSFCLVDWLRFDYFKRRKSKCSFFFSSDLTETIKSIRRQPQNVFSIPYRINNRLTSVTKWYVSSKQRRVITRILHVYRSIQSTRLEIMLSLRPLILEPVSMSSAVLRSFSFSFPYLYFL